MAKTRAIVKRRKAIRNIRKITRTMELIATTRFRKALNRAVEAEAFTQKIAEIAADLSRSASNITHPLLKPHDQVKNSLLLVLSSNRGLCGGYNAGILREALHRVHQLQDESVQLLLELSGKRAITYFRFHKMSAQATYTNFEDKPTFAEVEPLADRYITEYVAGRIDRVDVAYVKFINAARQVAVVETLLPLSSVTVETRHKAVRQQQTLVDYEFLPSAREILEEILPLSFKVRLFQCFLDAAVSEQIARKVAMTAATENAGEMIKTLTRQYNRARQAQITKEIAEVVGGAEALK
jgi:F-type H+-transporting ATPase subunit gamma